MSAAFNFNEVQNGQSITITNRGEPVAKLIPFKNEQKEYTRLEAIKQLAKVRSSIKKKINISELVKEGRKY